MSQNQRNETVDSFAKAQMRRAVRKHRSRVRFVRWRYRAGMAKDTP